MHYKHHHPPSVAKFNQKPELAELHRQKGLNLHKSVISTKQAIPDLWQNLINSSDK